MRYHIVYNEEFLNKKGHTLTKMHVGVIKRVTFRQVMMLGDLINFKCIFSDTSL